MRPVTLPVPARDMPSAEHPSLVCAAYLVVAEAMPGMLSRLIEPFAKRDLVPDAFEARREGDVFRLAIRLDAVDAGELHRAIGNLSQIVGVVSIQQAAPAVREMAA